MQELEIIGIARLLILAKPGVKLSVIRATCPEGPLKVCVLRESPGHALTPSSTMNIITGVPTWKLTVFLCQLFLQQDG